MVDNKKIFNNLQKKIRLNGSRDFLIRIMDLKSRIWMCEQPHAVQARTTPTSSTNASIQFAISPGGRRGSERNYQ